MFCRQGSAGADSGLGSDETGPTSNRMTTTVNGEQVVLRRSKKSNHSKQRPKSEMVRHPAQFQQLDVVPSASVCNLKPSESVRRSKRYSAFGVRILKVLTSPLITNKCIAG